MKRPLEVQQPTNDDDDAENCVKVKRVVCKGKAPVDIECVDKVDSAYVYYEGDDIYDVMLNQTNVQNNNNKYYIIQLLKDENINKYSVWCRWGRVGKSGQSKLESFGCNLQAAKNCFKKKFLDKTLNQWEERMHFIKHKGKYDLVEIDYGVQDENVTIETKKTEEIKSRLPVAVQVLMQLICDMDNMEQVMTELKYDSRRAPLGKLSKSQIQAGYTALDNISKLIVAFSGLSQNCDTETETKPKGRVKRVKTNASDKRKFEEQLLLACNDFYTRIPHDFGMRVPPVIRTMPEVKSKIELLEALSDIEFAVNIMKNNQSSTENIIDVNYKRLNCEIQPLQSIDPMYSLLTDYMHQTHGITHNMYTLEILDIFECQKSPEKGSFKDYGNRMLLWHGSRLTNWVGILGRGLQIAPPEAPSSGYMFGKGVYFADCSSKSANYVYPTQANNIGLILACEVSLGKQRELYQSCCNAHENRSNYHSVKGVGKWRTNPETWKTLDDGVVVPCGKLIQAPEIEAKKCVLQFNEYIVYSVNQIRLRYLFKVKFNFNH
ncbi:Poly [ADP-ribose] polymerase 2 [Schistosoma japonicum]|uniref:Poly [ADP-ribose] polymerase n=1 Tax=Schistosoma japonicum TaxID=6182 RepID=A0A4Z2D7A9_SCHJA|nr:Poly [ADP-ribose] polymerase 2 [Schistosoma japonicum]